MKLRVTAWRALAASFYITVVSLRASALHAQAADAHAHAAEASNAFAFDAYGVLRSTDTNLVFCPFGLHRLLSVALEGAHGRTEEELTRRLHWSATADERHASQKALGQSLGSSMQQGGISLQSTNRLWLSSRGSLKPAFRDLAVKLYGAKLETLDFSDPDKAIAYMNATVSGDTNARVPTLLPPGSLDAETTLVLANTVYFKGMWIAPFDRRKTAARPFYPLGKQQPIPCVTMMLNADLGAHEDSELQAIAIPFSGSMDLSMLFLLPVKRDGLRDLEKSLSAERIHEIAQGLKPMPVTVFLPKYSFSVGGGYGAILATLGLQSVFDRKKADFTGMSALRPHVREIWHETTIEVNELGGEATAATAIPADPFGPAPSPVAPPLARRMLFNADHPFVFLVRHRPTGLVLFLGRFAGP